MCMKEDACSKEAKHIHKLNSRKQMKAEESNRLLDMEGSFKSFGQQMGEVIPC